MKVTAWSDGHSTYGIRVGKKLRDEYFETVWTEIEVEIEGHSHKFKLTRGFWNHCAEFRDSGSTVIRDWMNVKGVLNWQKGHPPRFELTHIDRNRFKLSYRNPDLESVAEK